MSQCRQHLAGTHLPRCQPGPKRPPELRAPPTQEGTKTQTRSCECRESISQKIRSWQHLNNISLRFSRNLQNTTTCDSHSSVRPHDRTATRSDGPASKRRPSAPLATRPPIPAVASTGHTSRTFPAFLRFPSPIARRESCSSGALLIEQAV